MDYKLEQINIHHDFIEADIENFIRLYDISLTRYMVHYKFNHYNNLEYSLDPEKIKEIEKDFIKRTLRILKTNKKEIDKLNAEIFTDFLKENEMTVKEFYAGHDEGTAKAFDIYLYDQRKEYTPKLQRQDVSFFMKMNFLLVKANKLGCVIELQDDFKFEEIAELTPGSVLDLSHTRASEKIIYLNELGIIDFLRKKEPFKRSINKLAIALSAITDEKSVTLQSALNAMLTTTNSEQKNPYYSADTAPKVQANLINLGCDILGKETIKNKN